MLRLLCADAYHWDMCANIQLLISVQTGAVAAPRAGWLSAFLAMKQLLLFAVFSSLWFTLSGAQTPNSRGGEEKTPHTVICANTTFYWQNLPGPIHPSPCERLHADLAPRILPSALLPGSSSQAADIKLRAEGRDAAPNSSH